MSSKGVEAAAAYLRECLPFLGRGVSVPAREQLPPGRYEIHFPEEVVALNGLSFPPLPVDLPDEPTICGEE